ncbi:hypothetical protein NC651_020333 [Populus alba x Populus x berolinensis]|nr:hypothetical protein NC651_020333 [Populus alba x Populus x berolinensis]
MEGLSLRLLFAVWYLSTLDILFIQLLKGGIHQLTRNLACELAKYNIRVNSVAPWFIRTPMTEDGPKNENVVKELAYQTPMRRAGEPGEVSSVVAFLCLPAPSFTTGQLLTFMSGICKIKCDIIISPDAIYSLQDGLADALTKALPRTEFRYLRTKTGVSVEPAPTCDLEIQTRQNLSRLESGERRAEGRYLSKEKHKTCIKMSTMKFCRECNNILYPREDRDQKILLYACRNCDHQEIADDNCVYRNEVHHSVAERTQVLQDVAADPTLPRTKAVTCTVCKHPEAVFFQATSRGEEGMTLFFVCCNPNCGHRWRD